MPSNIADDGGSLSGMALPASPQRDTATSRPAGSPSRAAAFVSGIGNAVVEAIRVLSPSRRPLYEIIGESPFAHSLVDSSISANHETSVNDEDDDDEDDTLQTTSYAAAEETTETILQMAADDEAEEGDGGNSDVEGGEVDDHFDAMMSHLDELDNDNDLNERGEISALLIPGAPDGWIPPGPPVGFLGYMPKLDLNATAHFSDVENPGRWSEYVFQPKYGQGASEWKRAEDLRWAPNTSKCKGCPAKPRRHS